VISGVYTYCYAASLRPAKLSFGYVVPLKEMVALKV
jgi:hypothetical protein